MDKAVTRDGRESLISIPTHLAKLVLMPQMEGQRGKREYRVHGLLIY